MSNLEIFDVFIFAGEPSGDLHGEALIQELLKVNRNLKIGGVFGPKMRSVCKNSFLNMENFQIMGFIDVFLTLPKLIKNFFIIRNLILKINPKAVVLIDYADFNLRLSASLRKKGYKGKITQYISPSVWAWRKNRIFTMEKNLDLLLTIFPFEKEHFAKTSLNVKYIGHPLAKIKTPAKQKNEILQIGIFPGSRKKEVERNFPIQLKALENIYAKNNNLKFAISIHQKELVLPLLEKSILPKDKIVLFDPSNNYAIMSNIDFAIAKSGTVTLELAMHLVPTIVTFAIKPLDVFIGKNILKIILSFYCIVNIIFNKQVFPELFGPNLTVARLTSEIENLLYNDEAKKQCRLECENIKQALNAKNPSSEASKEILSLI
ncbi:MAG: lipid-A-disaccharide synthase [Chlamydiae bacterium]|nr:lipid-A-disaccharide synthase [Chlamydiota bacterium]